MKDQGKNKMDSNDNMIFISHPSNARSICVELSKVLEPSGIKIWYSERDIPETQYYGDLLTEKIKESSLFVLLVNTAANASTHVKREVTIADKYKKTILIAQLDYSEDAHFIEYVKSTSQYLTLCGLNKVLAAQQLAKSISLVYGMDNMGTAVPDPAERRSNELDFFGDEGERKRLKSQHSFVYEFAKDHYDEFISSVNHAAFLDVGCSTAEQAMMFCNGRKEIDCFVGIDREQAALDRAAELFPQAHFVRCDFESGELDETLCDTEEKLGIEGFDIINLSMVLLYIKEPVEFLDVLSKHLNPGGRFIIIDIDDGFNIAYPDPKEIFGRAVEICSVSKYSGCRTNGRQICKMLSEIEMSCIQLHKSGISTVGMKRDRREEFFDIYFWFVLDDMRKMAAENPGEQLYASYLEELERNYKTMKRDFKNKEFFFNIGFMLYSAIKP